MPVLWLHIPVIVRRDKMERFWGAGRALSLRKAALLFFFQQSRELEVLTLSRFFIVPYTYRTESQAHLQLLHVDRPAIGSHPPAPPVNETHCFLPSHLHFLPTIT